MTKTQFKHANYERITGNKITNTHTPSKSEEKLLDYIYKQELEIIEITKTYAQEIEAESCYR